MSVAVVAWLAAVSLDKGSEGLCVLNYAEEQFVLKVKGMLFTTLVTWP